MDAGLLLAIGAVLVALAAFVHSVITSRHERRDRRAELELLREGQAAQRRALLYAERGEIRWSPIEYDFTLGNSGSSAARNIRVWLEAGASTVAADRLGPMQPGELRRLTIDMGGRFPHRGDTTPASLMAVWTDDAGDHDATLLTDLPSGP